MLLLAEDEDSLMGSLRIRSHSTVSFIRDGTSQGVIDQVTGESGVNNAKCADNVNG